MRRFTFLSVYAVLTLSWCCADARAGLILKLSSGGSSVTVTDTNNDGSVAYSGSLNGFTVSTTGLSAPVIGPPAITSLGNISVTGAGVLDIMVTDTDFTDLAPVSGLLFNIDGTTTGSLTALSAGADNNQGEFVVSSPVALPGPFNASSFATTTSGPFTPDGSFSLTQSLRITHQNINDQTTFSSQLEVTTLASVPEPGSLAIWACAIGLLGRGCGYRRQRKTAVHRLN